MVILITDLTESFVLQRLVSSQSLTEDDVEWRRVDECEMWSGSRWCGFMYKFFTVVLVCITVVPELWIEAQISFLLHRCSTSSLMLSNHVATFGLEMMKTFQAPLWLFTYQLSSFRTICIYFLWIISFVCCVNVLCSIKTLFAICRCLIHIFVHLKHVRCALQCLLWAETLFFSFLMFSIIPGHL